MLYGVAGAHHSGKTTLARQVADDLAIHFHATSTTEAAKRHGYDPVAPMTLKDRVDLQYKLLEDHISEVTEGTRPMIVDRTPLDQASYLLAEFYMTSSRAANPATMKRAAEYVDLCLEATRKLYDVLFYVCPLDHYTMEGDKARPDFNPAFQRHHAICVQGCIAELKNTVSFYSIYLTDFETRRKFLCEQISQRLMTIHAERTSALHLH